MVRYRGSCDVYLKTYVWDSDTATMVFDWDYANPEKIKCNVTELSPDNVQELFNNGYQYTKTIKLETDISLDLSMRIANIRLDGPVFEDMMFNVDNVQPRIDYRGKVIGYRVICRSTNV